MVRRTRSLQHCKKLAVDATAKEIMPRSKEEKRRESTRGYHETPEPQTLRCVSQAPVAAGGGGIGGIDSDSLTEDTPLFNELLRDSLPNELTSELFLAVAARYSSGESGLSSSNVPIGLRVRSQIVGRWDDFQTSRTEAGD
jgi:hypothetical protein